MDVEKIIQRLKGSGNTARLERQVLNGDSPTEEERDDLLVAVGKMLIPNFVIDESNEDLYTNLRKWADGIPFTCCDDRGAYSVPGSIYRGIYIAGPTGTGKSVALDVMREYCRGMGLKVRIGTETKPLAWTSAMAGTICDAYAAGGSLTLYKEETVLCIQDLGTEPEEATYMGNRVSPLRSILEYRGDRRTQLTLITSNASIAKAGKVYGDRVASRLRGICNYFVLKGTDRRSRSDIDDKQ